MGGRGALVGRERELAALAAFLDDPGAHGLVLTGDAGVGKTALWDLTAGLAEDRGHLVLVSTPGEGEERLSFGVLNDLFRDVDLDALELREPVRTTLAAALFRSAAAAPLEPQLVSIGVHDLLSALSDARRVVVFVDDAQWGDPGSLEALSFAARRLTRAQVQYVLTRRAGFARTSIEAALVRHDLRHMEPRALSLDETARLLSQELGLNVSPRVLRLVHDQARGNPLFVLEIGRVLREGGVPDVGEPLVIPTEMAEVLGLRVADLAEDERTLLLAVALAPHLTEDAAVELAGRDTVERAVRERVVTVTERGRVRVWHPLLAAAAREGSSPASQREVHRRLADVIDQPDQRIRHLALATHGPDEDMAVSLSSAAAGASARGASETALELADLALERTPADSPSRIDRVLDLASHMASASEAHELTELLEAEIASMPFGPERGRARLMMLEGIVGDLANYERLLDLALDECDADPAVRGRALSGKAFVCGFMKVSSIPDAMSLAEEAIELGVGSEDRDWCLVHLGQPATDPTGPAQGRRWVWRGEVARAEVSLRAALAEAEKAGQLQQVIMRQVELVDVLVRCGRIREARELSDSQSAVDLTAVESPDFLLLQAGLDAASGDAEGARSRAHTALAAAQDFGHIGIGLHARRIMALGALQAGDLGEASSRLSAVLDHVRTAGVRDPGVFPVAPDLIETLLFQGRYAEARDVLSWLDEVSIEQEHPWGLAMARRSRLLLDLLQEASSPQDVSAGTSAVAEQLQDLGLLHDAARAHLVIGSALRRRRQWGLARSHLESARVLFDSLGAEGWAGSARDELSRVGGRRRTAEGVLTATEREVSRLAAGGLANKQIARQMNISISTVEAHLTRAFAKLGVQSRSQLGARLDQAAED